MPTSGSFGPSAFSLASIARCASSTASRSRPCVRAHRAAVVEQPATDQLVPAHAPQHRLGVAAPGSRRRRSAAAHAGGDTPASPPPRPRPRRGGTARRSRPRPRARGCRCPCRNIQVHPALDQQHLGQQRARSRPDAPRPRARRSRGCPRRRARRARARGCPTAAPRMLSTTTQVAESAGGRTIARNSSHRSSARAYPARSRRSRRSRRCRPSPGAARGTARADRAAPRRAPTCAGPAPRSTARRARASPRRRRRRRRSSGARTDRARGSSPRTRSPRRACPSPGTRGGSLPSPRCRRRARRPMASGASQIPASLAAAPSAKRRVPASAASDRSSASNAAIVGKRPSGSTFRPRKSASRTRRGTRVPAGSGARGPRPRAGQLQQVGARERALAVERLVQRDAEAELIGARVGGVAAKLLGRHVGRRSDHRARPGSASVQRQPAITGGVVRRTRPSPSMT